MGVLDIVNGYNDIQTFLSKQENLGDDLLALKKVAEEWKSRTIIDVGESGTLYRFLKFASRKLGLNKRFITQGTLTKRDINDDPKIINLTQTKLLKLDQGTSQWASAAVLLGDNERIENAPFKLKLTYEVIDHWKAQRKRNLSWEPHYDETILSQMETYLKILNKEEVKFVPKQAEDFCFAYILAT